MLNKKNITTFFLSIIIFSSLNALELTYINNKQYIKHEYDMADYVPHSNGIGEVFIDKFNSNKSIVELYFFTSTYKMYYHINFTDNFFDGYAERTEYMTQYDTGHATTIEFEKFNGDILMLDKDNFLSKKYIQIAWEILQESK